jgi:hypothetical protein
LLEDKEYQEAYLELLNKSEEIVDWKINRTLEEAKLLSVAPEFHKAVVKLRERWKIIPCLHENIIQPALVLRECTSHLSNEERKQMEKDIQDLAKKFDLDWLDEGEDYGLIVGAICYGLTPENLTTNWEKIQLSMASTRTPGVRLIRYNQDHIKKLGANLIVISYLFLQLRKTGMQFEFPEPIREVVLGALRSVGKLGETAERATEFIQKLQKAHSPTDLYIKVNRNTTLEDIKRTWPQVELRKAEYLRHPEGRRNSPKRRRIWRTYERDIFIWRKVKKSHMTYEAAYEEWLAAHSEEEPVEITAIIKAVSRIPNVPSDD